MTLDRNENVFLLSDISELNRGAIAKYNLNNQTVNASGLLQADVDRWLAGSNIAAQVNRANRINWSTERDFGR